MSHSRAIEVLSLFKQGLNLIVTGLDRIIKEMKQEQITDLK